MPVISRREFVAAGAIAASFWGADVNAASNKRKKLAKTPPLGWNSFDCYGVYLHEEAAMANLESMAKKLKSSGYEYFVIDNGWFGEYKLVPGTKYPAEKHASDIRINEYGLVMPSKTYFPNGIKRIADRAHKLGLKFGVHLMRGIPRKAVEQNLPIKGTKYRARDIADTSSVCVWCHYNYGVDMDKPGAQEFYDSLVQHVADLGVDMIKADDLVPFPREIEGFANAIDKCDRDILLSLSPGRLADMDKMDVYRRGNMLRITSDVWDSVEDLDKCFDAWKKFQGTESPGFWPDLDMIPFGGLMLMCPESLGSGADAILAGKGYARQCQLTEDQQRTFITMRALAASPLFVGGDLPSLDDFSLGLLTNKEMLRCNQNGVMGHNVFDKDKVEIWLTPQTGKKNRGWMGLFNRNPEPKNISLSLNDMGLKSGGDYKFRDIWKDKKISSASGKLSCKIPADGVVFIRFE